MSQEKEVAGLDGWGFLGGLIVTLPIIVYILIKAAIGLEHGADGSVTMFIASLLALGLWIFCCCGFFTLEPNKSAVLTLFGAYKGSVKSSGFKWANPLLKKYKVSLRIRNFNSETLKVNDKKGNPIEIAVVVVWRVIETAQAVFDVDDYGDYVSVQSESAVRHLASSYAYDGAEGEELTLRASQDEVSKTLQGELQDRVNKAGVKIDEARISHLAYAPEIAGAMLKRQQADAIIAARQRIVDGAVGMVEMALQRMEKDNVIKLDEERKANMISNLMVVLCGDKDVHPVLNTGSLY
ncbi:SPFH domain-containing protein [Planctomycetota bacterium]